METICKECEGDGKIVKQFNGMWEWYFEDCPNCGGTGTIGQKKTPFWILIVALLIIVSILFKYCN